MARIHCALALHSGASIELPGDAARHVQVLRLQPGDEITLFEGGLSQGEFTARIEHMGRTAVQVQVLAHRAIEREAGCAVTLAVGMPANERMDWLVEKATELGAVAIQPLVSERSVLKLAPGERSERKLRHWRGIAVAACEQCGRNRVPSIAPPLSLGEWLGTLAPEAAGRWLLSLEPEAPALARAAGSQGTPALLLSGPEGGLSGPEQAAAQARGFRPASLGPRVLRAETAALAALAALTLER